MTRPGGVLAVVRRRSTGRFALAVVALVVVAAAVSLVWTPHPLLEIGEPWARPSLRHPLGTDRIGRDTASWLLAGARTTVLVVAGSVAVAAVVGVAFAVAAGLTRRWVAESVAVVVDVLVAFPTLLVAMLLAAPWGGSLLVVVVAVGLGAGVNLARVVRPDVLRVTRSDYVLAARACGAGGWGVVRDHVLPNVAPVVLVQLSVTASVSVLAEAGLSCLGLGAPGGTPSWGRSLADAQAYLTVAPWAVVWPGLAVTVTVLALNLLGDALRDGVDPASRRATADPSRRRAAADTSTRSDAVREGARVS